jgi:hypothetical protein
MYLIEIEKMLIKLKKRKNNNGAFNSNYRGRKYYHELGN